MCIILYACVSAQMPGLPEAVVTSRGHLPLLSPLSVSRGHWPSNHEGQCLTSPKAELVLQQKMSGPRKGQGEALDIVTGQQHAERYWGSS